MSIRLETIEAESPNSSNNNKNKHQWLLRKCLRIRSSPQKKKKNSISQLYEFVVRRRLFTYVVMWVVQDRERASSHTFGCHFWTTSSLWWNYKVHSSLSLFVCLFFGPTSVFVFVLFTVFTICLCLGCFIPYILKWTWTFFSFFSFFFSKVVHQLCMPICTACVDHQELQGYFHEFS